MKSTIFTICSNNYLAQALSLGKSVTKYNSDYQFVIGLVDKKCSSIDYTKIRFDIIEVEEIGVPDFSQMIDRYNITELNTAVKPFFFKYFWEKQDKTNSIIYLDPDIYVYNSFIELEKLLEIYDIILTPHCTNPIDDDKLPSENNFLNAGLYNLGFLAIRKTENAKIMINWWAKRLVDKAYNNFEKGMFTDQLWMNFTPLFFKNVCISLNPGYNMAYWNLHERSISYSSENYYVNNESLLVFYHFSGFDPTTPDSISKYQNRFSFEERPELIKLFNAYKNELFKEGYNYYISFKCKYVEIKETLDNKKINLKLNNLSFFKRFVRSIILRTIRFYKIDL